MHPSTSHISSSGGRSTLTAIVHQFASRYNVHANVRAHLLFSEPVQFGLTGATEFVCADNMVLDKYLGRAEYCAQITAGLTLCAIMKW